MLLLIISWHSGALGSSTQNDKKYKRNCSAKKLLNNKQQQRDQKDDDFHYAKYFGVNFTLCNNKISLDQDVGEIKFSPKMRVRVQTVEGPPPKKDGGRHHRIVGGGFAEVGQFPILALLEVNWPPRNLRYAVCGCIA